MNISSAQQMKVQNPQKYNELLAGPKAEKKIIDAIYGGRPLEQTNYFVHVNKSIEFLFFVCGSFLKMCDAMFSNSTGFFFG